MSESLNKFDEPSMPRNYVTQYQHNLAFFIQTEKSQKNNLHRTINQTELSKYAKFHKNPLQTHGI